MSTSALGHTRPKMAIVIRPEDFPQLEAELSVPTQEILQALPLIQDNDLAWDLAVHLLNSQSFNCNFYGAHTLHTKICRQWSNFKDSPEKREQIKQFLLSRLFFSLQNLDNRAAVTIKLFSALIVLAFQEFQNGWVTFLSDIMLAIDSAFLNQNKNAELVKLQFLTLLSEEFENPRMAFAHRGNLALYVGVDGRNMALSFIDRYTAISEGNFSSEFENLREKSLKCLHNWVQFGVPSLEIPHITDRLLQNFLWQGSHEICAEVLHEILNHRNTVQVQDTVYSKIFNWMISPIMQSQVQLALNGEDLSLARSLMRVYSSFGENFYTRVISDIGKIPQGEPIPQLIYLEMILSLTNYPGDFPTDQTISEVGLEFWHLFQEGVLEHVENKKSLTQDVGLVLNPIITKLVTVIQAKIMYPPNEDLRSWDADDLNSFRIYRRDAGDILSDVYYLLKDPYPVHYLNNVENMIRSMSSNSNIGSDQWQELEATLFLLRKVAVMINSSHSPAIIRLFSAEYLGKVLEINLTTAHQAFNNNYLKLQAIKMCGDFAKFYKSDQVVLSALTQQIICAFSDPILKISATTAFRDICDSASLELTFSVEAMIQTIYSLRDHLDPPELERMMESIACLVASANDSENLIPVRLEAMSSFIIHAQEKNLHDFLISPDEKIIETTINHFKYLIACADGSRLSNRPQDVDSVIYPTPASIPYTESVFLMISRTLEIMGNIDPIATAVSTLLKSGLKTLGIPSPFCFPLEPLVNLLTASYQKHVLASYLDIITQVVMTYAVKNLPSTEQNHIVYTRILADLALSTIELTMLSLNSPTNIQEHSELTSSMAEFLNKLISMAPHCLLLLPENAKHGILQFSVLSLTTQDRSTIRLVANFLCELYIFEKREEGYMQNSGLGADPLIRKLMKETYGIKILKQILECVGFSMPRSYLSLITEMFRKFLSVHHEESVRWLATLLSQENFPSPHIEVSIKEKFSKEFLRATNNSMQFKSLLNHFSQLCWATYTAPYSDIIFS